MKDLENRIANQLKTSNQEQFENLFRSNKEELIIPSSIEHSLIKHINELWAESQRNQKRDNLINRTIAILSLIAAVTLPLVLTA